MWYQLVIVLFLSEKKNPVNICFNSCTQQHKLVASLSEHLVHLYLMDPYIIPQATPQHDKVLIFGQYTNEPLICANTHTTTTKLVNGFL